MEVFKVFFEGYNYELVMAPSKSLGMENSFSGLPIDGVPYGFWVNKFGHFVVVNRMDHAKEAMNIIQNFNKSNPDNQIEFYDKIGPMSKLFQNGFIRVVSESNPIYWESSPTRHHELSQSQKKFLDYISKLYRKPYTQDTKGASY